MNGDSGPLKKTASRLLFMALFCLLLPDVAIGAGGPSSVLIGSAEYDFPYYGLIKDTVCHGFCPPGGAGEVHLTSDASGTYFQAWYFVAYAQNSACQKIGEYSEWWSSQGEPQMSVTASGELHYISKHPTKTTRLEVNATVLNNGKTVKGWFLIKLKVEGKNCTTGHVKFKASTNSERE